METQVSVREAKAHLSRLLQRVLNGESFVITRRGKPVAVLGPVEAAPEPRVPGIDAGKVAISDDFDAPLPEFEQTAD